LRYPGDKLLRFIRWRDSIGYRFEGGIWRIDLIDAAGKVTRTETISSNLTPLELVESANSDFSVRWSLMTQDGHELPSTEAFFKWMNGIPHLQGVLRAGQ
jgi:hypothetical protein